MCVFSRLGSGIMLNLEFPCNVCVCGAAGGSRGVGISVLVFLDRWGGRLAFRSSSQYVGMLINLLPELLYI